MSPVADSYAERLERGAVLLREASRVVAFTGAGISTESGISDFRSPGGVWARHRYTGSRSSSFRSGGCSSSAVGNHSGAIL